MIQAEFDQHMAELRRHAEALNSLSNSELVGFTNEPDADLTDDDYEATRIRDVLKVLNGE